VLAGQCRRNRCSREDPCHFPKLQLFGLATAARLLGPGTLFAARPIEPRDWREYVGPLVPSAKVLAKSASAPTRLHRASTFIIGCHDVPTARPIEDSTTTARGSRAARGPEGRGRTRPALRHGWSTRAARGCAGARGRGGAVGSWVGGWETPVSSC
jgi:hypothetical protein